ncbi:MAG: putative ATPase [Deltaproteobacteria bacterium]|nr:putative ATPase [Deltaproteobacteria bacterium]
MGQLKKQDTGESLYVIKGTVTNVGEAASDGIRIRATLLGKDNQVIVQNEAYAGNLIDESLMAHMNRVRIEGFLGMRYGEGNSNRTIPVGMSLPFMVVFFDPPEGVESFTVKAVNVDEPERIQSSGTDTEKSDTRISSQRSIRSN